MRTKETLRFDFLLNLKINLKGFAILFLILKINAQELPQQSQPTPFDTNQILEKKDTTISPSLTKEITIIKDDTTSSPVDNLPEIHDLGVAVAPAYIMFNVPPGKSQTKKLTITNDTYKKYKFAIKVTDYMVDEAGQRTVLKEGEYSPYSLSRWVKVVPPVITLNPGEIKKVDVIVELPDVPEVYRSLWAQLMLDEVIERDFTFLSEPPDPNKIVLGIIPSIGFIVWLYQNPPFVISNKVEITNFVFNQDSLNKYLEVEVKNLGDGIAQCKSYVIALNTKTGYKENIPLRVFTLFPGQKKKYSFTLPGTLPPGDYNITCVLDFGSKEEIQVAEMDITIK